MKKTTKEKSAVPSFMPIEVLKIVEYYFIDEPRIFHMSLLAELIYQEFLREDYGPYTKEIADWFWWAVRRHIMYRTGELEKDEWYKGGEDFEDFLNIEYQKKYSWFFSFKLMEYELPRLPEKYEKKYFYHRLNNIAFIANFLAEEHQLPVTNNLRYEYFEIIPLEIRKEYFTDKYKTDPLGEMKKFEKLLYKTREDYERDKKDSPGIPKKRTGPKARVYRFPFKLMQKTETSEAPDQKKVTDCYLSRFYKSWYNDRETNTEPDSKASFNRCHETEVSYQETKTRLEAKTAEVSRQEIESEAKTPEIPNQETRRITDRYMSSFYESWYTEDFRQKTKMLAKRKAKTYKKSCQKTKKVTEFLKGLRFLKIFARKPAWAR